MKKTKIGIGIILAVLLALPVSVGATTTNDLTGTSSMTVTVGTTNNASAGDTVTVRLVSSNNPGISTLGLQLGYDDEYLSYNGAATWSDTIQSNGIQMVSAATEDDKPVVNISAVFSDTYTSNETMVTLNFTVKRDYTEMSTYLTPTVREVSDANLADVTVNWVYDPNAGITGSDQNLVVDDTESDNTGSNTASGSGTNNSTGTGTDNSTGTGSGNTDTDTNTNTNTDTDSTGTGSGSTDTDSTGSGSGSTGTTGDGSGSAKTSTSSSGSAEGGTTNNYYYGGSSTGTNTTTGATKKGVDNTPTTGALNLPLVLSVIIVTFIAIAGVCLRILSKRKRGQA